MPILDSLLERRRLIIATACLLALAGLFSWTSMPREEDPRFPRRKGVLVVHFPGAGAEDVERLVVEPLEEHLAEVEQIAELYATARAGTAILRIEFDDRVYATDEGWDEVEDAIARARRDFPDGVGEPTLDNDIVEQTAVVLAIVGSPESPQGDRLALAAAVERVKRSLLALESVRKVEEVADPGEQITIEYDDATARRLGIDPQLLGAELGRRSRIVPGGHIHLGPKTATLDARTEMRSVAELASMPIVLPSGAAIPLGQVARVRRGPREPATDLMRWNGEPAVGLGVVPRYEIDRVAFGREVRQRVDEMRAAIAPLAIEEVVFQPAVVEKRLGQLAGSLRLSILIVTAVLFVFMGLRLGLLVALVLPFVTLSSLGLFASAGGVLHQVSIVALVIALGMLVDNAIVVVEAIQWRLDRGVAMAQAALEAVRELALPLGTATATTLAAFVPLLISKGDTADFTRSIPTLIMLALTVSYVFAVLVTPVLSKLFLRPRPSAKDAAETRVQLVARRAAGFAVERPFRVLAAAALLVAITLGAGRYVDRQFFPAADRRVVMIELEMPEGTHLQETDAVARRLEDALTARAEVESVASFVGRAAPHFYYNLLPKPRSPHRAELVVHVGRVADVEPTMAWTRDHVRRELPEVAVVARRLAQGPPVDAPVELRLYGHDLAELQEAADAVLVELRHVSGTRDVRHDVGLGVPTVTFEIDDATAGRHALGRSDVARTLYGRTLGTEIGQYRLAEDPVPILVRSSAGEKLDANRLATLDVSRAAGAPTPLGQLATLGVEWRPAALHRHQRGRLARVLSELAEGTTAHRVLGELRPRLEGLELPAGVRLVIGGEDRESGKASAALLRGMPLGVLLLLSFLLAEFNSFRRVGIILVTVPLAATGVVPGLLLSGQAFGFTAALGLISLVGIVVNNAIVLLDLIEKRRAAGLEIAAALQEAVERRTRPILLTMATTVAGLLPLAFSSSTLWPPLAWAMISGLLASTVLTLVVVPALYKVLIR